MAKQVGRSRTDSQNTGSRSRTDWHISHWDRIKAPGFRYRVKADVVLMQKQQRSIWLVSEAGTLRSSVYRLHNDWFMQYSCRCEDVIYVTLRILLMATAFASCCSLQHHNLPLIRCLVFLSGFMYVYERRLAPLYKTVNIYSQFMNCLILGS